MRLAIIEKMTSAKSLISFSLSRVIQLDQNAQHNIMLQDSSSVCMISQKNAIIYDNFLRDGYVLSSTYIVFANGINI